jgi:hypothetical protein
LTGLCRFLERTPVAVALDGVEDSQAFLVRARVKVGAEKPQALVPVFVDETVDRARELFRMGVHFTSRLTAPLSVGKKGRSPNR